MDPRRYIIFVSILMGAAPLLDAAALGLGEARLDSRLNEPLAVEVVLVGIDLETDKPVATIASEAMHVAAGITSGELLRRLRVEVSAAARQEAYIRVTTDESIRDPVVNFLLVVENGNEHVTREYTLLLDPPGYYPPTIALPASVREVEPFPDATLDPPPAPQTVDTPERIGPVLAGDTLSKLAMRLPKEQGATWAQMAWALYTANPQAFIDRNINLLRSGVYLRVPTSRTAARRTHREALALIKANPNSASAPGASALDSQPRPQPSPAVDSSMAGEPAELPTPAQDESQATASTSVATSESDAPQPVFRLLSPEAFDRTQSDGAVGASISPSEQENIDDLVAQANQKIQDGQEEMALARERLEATEQQISALAEVVDKKDLEIKGLESRLADLKELVKHQSTPRTEPEPPWLYRLLFEALLLTALVVVLAITLSRWTNARQRRDGHGDDGRIAPVLTLPAGYSFPPSPMALQGAREDDTHLPEEPLRAESPPSEESSLDATENHGIEHPDDALLEANAYLAYGYPEKAKEVLEEFIKGYPAHPEGRLLMLRVLHSIREKRRFRRHAEALLELVDNEIDERWTEAARLGRELLPEERLFHASTHRRAEDEKWEETVWTGSRPKLADSDGDTELDSEEFKYVDLFLLDKVEDAGNDSAPASSTDTTAKPDDDEADLAKWRAKMLAGHGGRVFGSDLEDPGDEKT